MGMERHPSAVGSNQIQPELMSSAETSAFLGVSLNTLQKWRSRNMGPKYVKYGGANSAAVRYITSDVIKFRNSHTVHTNNTDLGD